ncbi:MAG: MetS family NSS transporter small subunit [Firmicutes bacterium]|nr:MetS family NSS transporter small subunit [Bacillota bacterium]MTI71285.1 MetS family NSS transporter small subunit [Bacillota bacterium]
MTVGAWVMLVFGVVFLYGGLYLAISKTKKN